MTINETMLTAAELAALPPDQRAALGAGELEFDLERAEVGDIAWRGEGWHFRLRDGWSVALRSRERAAESADRYCEVTPYTIEGHIAPVRVSDAWIARCLRDAGVEPADGDRPWHPDYARARYAAGITGRPAPSDIREIHACHACDSEVAPDATGCPDHPGSELVVTGVRRAAALGLTPLAAPVARPGSSDYTPAVRAVLDAPALRGFAPRDFADLAMAAADQAGCAERELRGIREQLLRALERAP